MVEKDTSAREAAVASTQLCIPQLFEQAASSFPNHTALVCGHESLTYVELGARVDRITRTLVIRADVQPGDVVALALPRSVDLVAALLAVMKTGAVYLPVDPALPADRVRLMMEDAKPRLIVVDHETSTQNSDGPLRLSISDLAFEPEANATGFEAISPSRLAYVMYTSGSTGRPKGVEVTHGNIANLLHSLRRDPGCSSSDRFLALTTVSFDISLVELLLPLVCGGATVIARAHEQKDPATISAIVRQHGVTIAQGTPSTWRMLLDGGFHMRGQPRLSKIFCGGEAMSRSLADRLLDCADAIWNMYGPTEATVYASIWRVRRNREVVVGGPIENGRLYVLDNDLSPAPLGCPGELYVGGAGVARGYRNNHDLSSACFLADPFVSGGRMYRTGDQALVTAEGDLRVLGRIDDQVKVRGYRVELGDVQAAMSDHDEISDAVIICRGDDGLAAYYIRSSHPMDRPAEEDFSHSLRLWLAKRLPEYMIPAFFVELKTLPVTTSGKVDRNALPDPVTVLRKPAKQIGVSAMEHQLLAIWSRALGHDRIGTRDSFFEVGGNSLRLVRVQRELETRLGRPVPAPKLFEHYTIHSLAAYLEGSPSAGITLPDTANEPCHMGSNEDIAIVSMACRLPAGVTTPDEFWELLEAGADAITDVPEGRWGPDDEKGTSFCHRGGFITTTINAYDTTFFGISPREARSLDPSQYMTLETCWEAFERAGCTMDRLRGSQTGVFVGTSSIPAHHALDPAAVNKASELDGYSTTGSAGGTLSGRVSYQLGLEGPAMTVDTACSSSLVATHLACSSLRAGECDLAVSTGVSLLLGSGLHAEFDRLQGMSPDGRCRAFSSDAQGTGWAEGCVAVVLKRLSDARRDGNTIEGVMRGTAVNHDGRSGSLTTPSGSAQRRLIHTALRRARLAPADIDYIEAHGTGTKLGDPIEAAALAEVFGPSRTGDDGHVLLVGSAKSNIGHTQAAAGLVGLLKVILAMRNNVLPQSLHITEPTPVVDWKGANMFPVMKKRAWVPRRDQPRRAGISAFGIGGTNAHVIVEEPPSNTRVHVAADTAATAEKETEASQSISLPFLISGETDAALRMQAEKLHQYIRCGQSVDGGDTLQDIAYSLAIAHTHFRKRKVLVARDRADLLDKLGSFARSDPSLVPSPSITPDAKLAIMFTGQGSQWPGMGKDLYEVYPTFRRAVDEAASIFAKLLPQQQPPLTDAMFASPGTPASLLLDRTDYAQPALFTLGVALWSLWKSWGLAVPVIVLGHSLGEIIAAHVASVMDLADACRFVAARSGLMQAHGSDDYKMTSISGVATRDVEAAIQSLSCPGGAVDVDVAVRNTPTQTVISGRVHAVDMVAAHFSLRGGGVRTKNIVTGHAFHSRHMDALLEDLHAVTEAVRFHPPCLNVVSGVKGKLVAAGEIEDAVYWVRQVREPVRFADAIQAAANLGVGAFLELGPRPTLCGLGAECMPDLDDENDGNKSLAWLPSMRHKQASSSVLLHSVARLHEMGIPIDWSVYFAPYGCQRVVQLPTYAFDRAFVAHRTIQTKAVLNSIDTTNNDKHQQSIRKSQGHAFRIVWQTLHSMNAPRPQETWGILPAGRETEWTRSVTSSLEAAGLRLIRIESVSSSETLKGLLCLWDPEDNDADNALSQTQDFLIKGLRQLQSAAEMQLPSPLAWITRHAVGTGVKADDEDMRLGAAPLGGLMRTARSEHPELELRLVDLPGRTEVVGGDLLAKALTQDAEPECIVRNGKILIPRLQRAEDVTVEATAEEPRIIRRDGTVLITGGLGHLGLRVAEWLADCHGIRDLVLISRRGSETPGVEALVNKLSQLGVRVTLVAGDMADPQIVRTIIATLNDGDHQRPPLRGVVHAAGVVDSGVLSSMTPERCLTTLAPKAWGAWALHQATRHMDLDFFVVFSSISGILGMPGLANYAASNVFLDSLAHLRRSRDLPATSMAFGTWAGGHGMASRLGGSTLAHLTRFGLNQLTPGQGVRLLNESIISARPLTVAAALDLQRLRGYYIECQGRIPPFLHLLLEKKENIDRHSSMTTAQGQHLGEALNSANTEDHYNILLAMVRDIVASTLGFARSEDVDIDRPLREIGIDSLTAVQTRNHLSTLTGLVLSVNIVFHHPDLRALSRSLLAQLRDISASSSSSSSSIATVSVETETDVTSGSETVSHSPPNMESIRRGFLDSQLTFGRNAAQNRDRNSKRPTSVFLSGATGFVGASILHELLEQGITTHCLIRAKDVHAAQQRVVDTLKGYGLWCHDDHYAPLIIPVVGDMSKPLLGLEESTFDELAEQVEAVCHSGGLVDWMRPLEDYIGPNIVSTHEILRLASRSPGGLPVHLISTMSTLPRHMGLDLAESKDGGQEYGYGTSKYTAERLVAAARWRGAEATIYRLPYVTASSITGRFRTDRGDFLHNLIVGGLELGAFPHLNADMSAVLPVDYLAGSVVNIMTDRTGQQGRDYDFVNVNAPTCDEFFRLMGRVSNGADIISFGTWKDTAQRHATMYPASSLARISAIVDGYTEETAAGIFKGALVGEHVLGGKDYPSPSYDEQFMQRYWERITASCNR